VLFNRKSNFVRQPSEHCAASLRYPIILFAYLLLVCLGCWCCLSLVACMMMMMMLMMTVVLMTTGQYATEHWALYERSNRWQRAECVKCSPDVFTGWSSSLLLYSLSHWFTFTWMLLLCLSDVIQECYCVHGVSKNTPTINFKLGTRDYVVDITHRATLRSNRFSGGFPQIGEI